MYLTNWAFHVSNDGSVWVVKKFHSDLCDITSVASAAEHFVDLRKFYWLIL
jgi:hypothetical protein